MTGEPACSVNFVVKIFLPLTALTKIKMMMFHSCRNLARECYGINSTTVQHNEHPGV